MPIDLKPTEADNLTTNELTKWKFTSKTEPVR